MFSAESSGIGATVCTAGRFLLVAPFTKLEEEEEEEDPESTAPVPKIIILVLNINLFRKISLLLHFYLIFKEQLIRISNNNLTIKIYLVISILINSMILSNGYYIKIQLTYVNLTKLHATNGYKWKTSTDEKNLD